jgi:peptide/nickel transport system permease protein
MPPAEAAVAVPIAPPARAPRLRSRPIAFRLAVGWLALLAAGSLLLPLLPVAEYKDPSASLDAPVLAGAGVLAEHPLGTNRFGLDLLGRVLYGARVSLLVAGSAALLGMVVGGVLGLLAGDRRGWLDRVIGVFTNALLAVPGLVLLIAVVTVVGRSHPSRAIALGVLTIPINLRLARATTLSVSQREFVVAARTLGTTRRRILVRELAPLVARPLLAYLFVLIPLLVVADASLAFLELGTPQPEPTWGNMIAEGQNGVFEDHPHIVLVPSAAMFLTVFSLDVVAERLRARFDRGGRGAA